MHLNLLGGRKSEDQIPLRDRSFHSTQAKNNVSLSHVKFKAILHILGEKEESYLFGGGTKMVMNNLFHSSQLGRKMQSPKHILNWYSWETKIDWLTVELDLLFQALLYIYPYLVAFLRVAWLYGNGSDLLRSWSRSSWVQEVFHSNAPNDRSSRRSILTSDRGATSWLRHILSHTWFVLKELHVL